MLVTLGTCCFFVHQFASQYLRNVCLCLDITSQIALHKKCAGSQRPCPGTTFSDDADEDEDEDGSDDGEGDDGLEDELLQLKAVSLPHFSKRFVLAPWSRSLRSVCLWHIETIPSGPSLLMCCCRRAASASRRAHRRQRRCRSPRRQRRQIKRSWQVKQWRRPLRQAAQVRCRSCTLLMNAATTIFWACMAGSMNRSLATGWLGGAGCKRLVLISRLPLCRCLGRLRKDSWQIPEGQWPYKNGSHRLSSEQCSVGGGLQP